LASDDSSALQAEKIAQNNKNVAHKKNEDLLKDLFIKTPTTIKKNIRNYRKNTQKETGVPPPERLKLFCEFKI